MSTTTITEIVNHTTQAISIFNEENPSQTGGFATRLGPGETFRTDMWVPWCTQEADFSGHRIEIGTSGASFLIWQANEPDGDHVRVATDGFFHYTGAWAPGNNAVGGNRRINCNSPNTLYFEAV